MAEIIEVNFRKKQRVQKYTIHKNICVVCFKSVVFDSRLEESGQNEPYIEVSKGKFQCICQGCAVAIKGIVDENDWK